MKKYLFYPYKNQLSNKLKKFKDTILTNKINNYTIKTIYFKNTNNLKKILKENILYYFNKLKISKDNHVFIVGLGNENHTADSVGPKVLKHIKVNTYFNNFGINIKGIKVSAIEPGVLSTTGIDTFKIIKSVCDEIKPNLVILIDSMVCDEINYLNKVIEISDMGISCGSGIKGINTPINKENLGIPIISIGVVSAVEIKFKNKKNINFIPYLLSTKDIDEYVNEVSIIISEALNEVINYLS